MDVLRRSLTTLDDVLRAGAVRSVFQPIVDLDTGSVVAYEALARGPEGPLSEPTALFAAARADGRLPELDQACRAAAVRGATEQGLLAPLMLFVNVEPEVLDTAPLSDLMALAEGGGGDLRVVLEITERSLATRPAELLRSIERVRAMGWGVALDDVGAESTSLAFMPLLRPDIVKLDLRLVQERPDSAIAEIMNAVNAYAERTGALLLAEGIENEGHLKIARALGATLGQGYLFGRPTRGAAPALRTGSLVLPPAPEHPSLSPHTSPFALLPPGTVLRRSPKSLLVELSKQLEREAMRLGDTCVVATTFQEARHFTAATAQRYRDLVARVGFVCALGEDLSVEPVPGLRGAPLAPDDAVRGEWDIVVLSPHFSAALLARDLGDLGPDMERRFEFALTYERDTVVAAARSLIRRVAPRPDGDPDLTGVLRAGRRATEPPRTPGPGPASPATVLMLAAGTAARESLLQQALTATTSGVTISDMRRPDQPLVFVNTAFEALSGVGQAELLGRNCRFLQGPDTDAAAAGRMRSAVSAGQEWRETLLNYRGPEREPWWNEVFLTPVVDDTGAVVQYIGVQTDVTARVDAERALAQERDRGRALQARVDRLSYTDGVTGLLTRRGLDERLEAALWTARACDKAVALLFVDLDGFRAVNATHGYAAGDQLLRVVGERLQHLLRRNDLLARLGGDQFLVALPDLEPGTAFVEAARKADVLVEALGQPVPLSPLSTSATHLTVDAGFGLSTFPADGDDLETLMCVAEARMTRRKHPPTG